MVYYAFYDIPIIFVCELGFLGIIKTFCFKRHGCVWNRDESSKPKNLWSLFYLTITTLLPHPFILMINYICILYEVVLYVIDIISIE